MTQSFLYINRKQFPYGEIQVVTLYPKILDVCRSTILISKNERGREVIQDNANHLYAGSTSCIKFCS